MDYSKIQIPDALMEKYKESEKEDEVFEYTKHNAKYDVEIPDALMQTHKELEKKEEREIDED